jgi:TolB protein
MKVAWLAAGSNILAACLLASSVGVVCAAGPAGSDAPSKPALGPAGELLFTSMRTGSSQIFRIDANGGRETRLTQSQSSELQPVWARDGRIAFVSLRSGGGDIYTMNADGGDLRQITSQPGLEQSPAWSPDGKHIAYVSERDGRAGLWVVQADGGQEKLVSAALTEVGSPQWSPDSTKIAFISTVGNKTRVVVADLATGSVGPVTDGKGGEHSPVWSPDGESIVYVHAGGRTEGIILRSVRLGNPASVALTGSGYTNSQPRFSPDGSKLLFLSNASTQGGPMNVHLMNADGTGITNLTHWEHADMSAAWSSDGEQVFFMSFRDWPGQIYRVNVDGSDVQRLTRSTAQDGFPVGRPGGGALPPAQVRVQ